MEKRPSWIRGKVSWSKTYEAVKDLLHHKKVKTVCVEARCPNKGDCWDNKHVTFMLLGDICTRACRFCNVLKGEGADIDCNESSRIAEAVEALGKWYVVVTSVTRDDIADGGAAEFVKTVKEIKKTSPETVVELLIPDFKGDRDALQMVLSSGAEVIGHNIEMPKILYKEVRPSSNYDVSLGVLQTLNELRSGNPELLLKSSMILGLGEEEKDIYETMEDLMRAGTDILYLGQYLNPTPVAFPVKRFYTPEEFGKLKEKAEDMGFKAVESGPMVRSSYNAHDAYTRAKKHKKSQA